MVVAGTPAILQRVNQSSGSRHDPLASLRQRGFLWFSIARFASGAGQTLLQAALAWQAYDLSGSAATLGIIGMVRFFPQLLAALYAGAVADRYDRKRIVLIAQAVSPLCAAVLLVTTLSGAISLPLIYVLVACIGLGAAFEGPARQALLPSIVRVEAFQNAITFNSLNQSLAFMAGPALFIPLSQIGDVAAAYAFNVVLLVPAAVGVLALHPRPSSDPPREITWSSITEGIVFVARRQPVLGSMALDMFAVIFAGATALLPIYAKDILLVGQSGYGALGLAMPVGAFVMSIVLLMRRQVEHTGRVLIYSVAVFGLATIVFGLSRSFVLSMAALAVAGMADQASVVMRGTTIQLATPDALRGRVTAVAQIFIGTSNQIGAAESGFVAAATNATFAVVSGGIGCLVALGALTAALPELRSFTIRGIVEDARCAEDEERASRADKSGEAAGG